MENKCKLKDLIHDLIEVFDVSSIEMDVSGIGMAVADELRNNGVSVNGL